MGKISDEAKRALDLQDACSISGVVRTFNNTLSVLWEIARLKNEGTDWVNEHPISQIYADKIAHLSSTQTLGEKNTMNAFDICEKLACGNIKGLEKWSD